MRRVCGLVYDAVDDDGDAGQQIEMEEAEAIEDDEEMKDTEQGRKAGDKQEVQESRRYSKCAGGL